MIDRTVELRVRDGVVLAASRPIPPLTVLLWLSRYLAVTYDVSSRVLKNERMIHDFWLARN